MAGKRIVVVAAHPDDCEWYAGGTIEWLARQGAEITYIICTEGEKGSYDPDVNPVALAARRKRELRAAADLLGVKDVVYLGHPDGGLENSPEVRRQLATLFRLLQPELLIAFDPWKRYELHPDHRAAGFAALDAHIAARMPLYETHTRAEGLMAWTIPEVWLFNPEETNYYVDILGSFPLKLKALRLHESQNVWGEDSVEHLTAMAKTGGERAGWTMAEEFHRIVFEGQSQNRR